MQIIRKTTTYVEYHYVDDTRALYQLIPTPGRNDGNLTTQTTSDELTEWYTILREAESDQTLGALVEKVKMYYELKFK